MLGRVVSIACNGNRVIGANLADFAHKNGVFPGHKNSISNCGSIRHSKPQPLQMQARALSTGWVRLAAPCFI